MSATGYMFEVRVNQRLCRELDISFNAALIFGVIKNLMQLSYIDRVQHNGEMFTVIYQNMILKQIPYVSIKKRTLSSVMQELLEVGLLKSNDNNSSPAYAFTTIADKYITSADSSDVSVDTKQSKKPLFSLNKATAAKDMKRDYYSLLREHSLDICKKEGIPSDEFDKFIDFNNSKDKKFTNWLSAFRNWVRNYKKWNANGGENKNGMYES